MSLLFMGAGCFDLLINNKLLYEKAHLIQIGKPNDSLYYFFDYDERYYDINMEFQHFHNFYEIHILLDNDASHIIEGRLYRIDFLTLYALSRIPCTNPYILKVLQKKGLLFSLIFLFIRVYCRMK